MSTFDAMNDNMEMYEQYNEELTLIENYQSIIMEDRALDLFLKQLYDSMSENFNKTQTDEEYNVSDIVEGYRRRMAKIGNKKKKGKSGQEFLLKKLAAKKSNLDEKAGRRKAKIENQLRVTSKAPKKNDLYKYFLGFKVMDNNQNESFRDNSELYEEGFFDDYNRSNRGEESTKDTLGSGYLKESNKVVERRLFSLNVCAFLRIVHNMLTYKPSHLGVEYTIQFVKSSMNQIIRVCEYGDWGEGFIASKFLAIVTEVVEQGSNGDMVSFEQAIDNYAIIFTSLSKILSFFQIKFSASKNTDLSYEELELLNEIATTMFKSVHTVKRHINIDVDERLEQLNLKKFVKK